MDIVIDLHDQEHLPRAIGVYDKIEHVPHGDGFQNHLKSEPTGPETFLGFISGNKTHIRKVEPFFKNSIRNLSFAKFASDSQCRQRGGSDSANLRLCR